ncbi:MAG: trimethylamine methyltransferase family protein, partial [Sneathiella sp.]
MSQRTRRSRGNRTRRTGGALNQLPWAQINNPYRPVDIVSEENIDAICGAAFDILETIGVDILHEGARQVFEKSGARVEGERVRIGRDIIETALKSAPKTLTLHARNP